ncbi:alpha/beta hydrolase [Chryseobacterium gleum]|uniref:alpha/beta hydrolase n=1 Tax=Chryseobacterium gleum TaxID=250 RepID=UPI00293F2C62|nr:alpha/beta hydrolase [Chryseobacterium gleum]
MSQNKKRKGMRIKKIVFKNRNWNISGNLHLPDNFDETKQYTTIVCVHPGSSVKEQTAGLYAQKLADQGFIALAYDASFQGESGGEQRYLEDPITRVEDIRCAVDYLTTLDFVDKDSIGILGICAGGGYAANAAMTERRIKAVATVVGTNASRAFRESNYLETLEAVSAQRTAEANGKEPMIVNWTPNSVKEAKKAGMDELDMLGAIDYYRTPRGEYPTSNNKLLFTSMSNLILFDAFHLAEFLLTQPLLVIVGDKVGAFGSYRDGFDLYNKAASKNKKIHIVKEASHYDLYDQPKAMSEALKNLIPFFKENLSEK